SMLKGGYIGSFMKTKSTGRHVVSCISNNSPTSEVLQYYSLEGVRYLQNVLNDIVASLAKVSITSEPQSEEQFPLCYGEDYVSKFKVLGKVIKLPYLFQNLLGKTEGYQKMKLSRKSDRYYNMFKEEELKQINSAIRTIAINIASINLVYDEELEKNAVTISKMLYEKYRK
ncbi:MAG: hypothetical protein J6Y15_11295, partial [Bacteroidaceae bacterium]|nr:hypothetical protein [Bacteroidaceae bacterium]